MGARGLPLFTFAVGLLGGMLLEHFFAKHVEGKADVVPSNKVGAGPDLHDDNFRFMNSPEREHVTMEPGLERTFMGKGAVFGIKVFEPTIDPKRSRDLVFIDGEVRNTSTTRVAFYEFLETRPTTRDDFGNVSTGHIGGTWGRNRGTVYPGEMTKVEWFFDRPVPGATVTYEFGLDGRIGVMKKFWPKAVPVEDRKIGFRPLWVPFQTRDGLPREDKP